MSWVGTDGSQAWVCWDRNNPVQGWFRASSKTSNLFLFTDLSLKKEAKFKLMKKFSGVIYLVINLQLIKEDNFTNLIN